MGGWGEYVKIMIDSGNTLGDLVSEEFAQQMGLDGDEVQDYIAVPTAATATTVLVVKRCQEITTKLEGIEGDFIMRPLVVRGLTHPVNVPAGHEGRVREGGLEKQEGRRRRGSQPGAGRRRRSQTRRRRGRRVSCVPWRRC